jgi:hypothetical protein
MGAGIKGADTAGAEVAVTTITTIMGEADMATAAITTADITEAATIPGTAGAIGIGALGGSRVSLPDLAPLGGAPRR